MSQTHSIGTVLGHDCGIGKVPEGCKGLLTEDRLDNTSYQDYLKKYYAVSSINFKVLKDI